MAPDSIVVVVLFAQKVSFIALPAPSLSFPLPPELSFLQFLSQYSYKCHKHIRVCDIMSGAFIFEGWIFGKRGLEICICRQFGL